jgi:GTPase SAR1 family protein
MSARELSAAVERLCRKLEDAGDPTMRDGVKAVRELAEETLNVAVVGKVKAGKSTLVNLLVGKKVAATDERECTKVVTHYRYAPVASAEVVLKDGRAESVVLDGWVLPSELGHSLADISHIVVWLPASALRDFSLIDTPGLATTTTGLAENTRDAVLGEDGTRLADTVIYLFSDTQFADDVAFLAEFAQVQATTARTSARAVGVLSHADTFGSGPWGDDDPIPLAMARAQEIAQARGAELATVVALAGRLGEASRTGQIGEIQAKALADLVEVDVLDLADPQADLPVEPDVVDGLVALVGEYGLRHGRAHATAGAGAVRDWMYNVSGAKELREALAAVFVGRSGHVRAQRAIELLRESARRSSESKQMMDIIEDALIEADFHGLRELHAWEALAGEHGSHEARQVLADLMSARTDAEALGLREGAASSEIAAAARLALQEAQEHANLAVDPLVARAREVATRSYTLIALKHRES